MCSVNVEIEKIKKQLFIERIQNEMEDLSEDTTRYTFLSSILKNIPNDDNILEKTLESVYHNTFKKTWSKLPSYHKFQKVKEYLDSKKLSQLERKKLEDKIILKINDKTLNTCKYVTYDTNTCKITKIILDKVII